VGKSSIHILDSKIAGEMLPSRWENHLYIYVLIICVHKQTFNPVGCVDLNKKSRLWLCDCNGLWLVKFQVT
jgi:hypothetical protein